MSLEADLRAAGLRGRLTPRADLSKITWFRTGGPADLLFEPADEADLSAFLAALPDDVPLTVVGIGSNLMVRDGGVEGRGGLVGVGVGDLDEGLARRRVAHGEGGAVTGVAPLPPDEELRGGVLEG